MQRIEVLTERYRERLEVLRGATLSTVPDDVLQALVAEAAHRLKTPMAVVSLILERTQYFRAQHGLPPPLALSLATDRDTSFCQFVVRDDQPFEVQDVQADPRVPQLLAERFGVRAYLGVPLHVSGRTVGALCTVDVKARAFSAEERGALEALAWNVSRRLEALAGSEPLAAVRPELLARASSPLFAEFRNAVGALRANVAFARITALEAGLAFRTLLPKSGLPPGEDASASLAHAARAIDELPSVLADCEQDEARLSRMILALQRLLGENKKPLSLAELLQLAGELAHHQLKLIGGVEWTGTPGQAVLRAPRAVAGALLGTTLSAVATAVAREKDHRGLQAKVEIDGTGALLTVGDARLPKEFFAEQLRALGALVGHDPFLQVRATDTALVLAVALGP